MPSINDLKTTKAYTGTGVSNEEIMKIDNPNVKKGPSAADVHVVNRDDNQQQLTSDNVGVMNIQNPNIQRHRKGAPVTPAPVKRKIADLSSLPKAEPMGVDVKESIEDEIFKPGGPFEAALAEKTKEMLEINEMIDQHNAMVAAERGEEVPSDEELQKIGSEDLTPVLKGTKYYDQADAYGRAQGAIKKSPIEDKAEKEGREAFRENANDDGSIKRDEVTTMNTNIEEDEDEMEKEINAELEKEFNESAASTAAKQQSLKVNVAKAPAAPKEEEKVEETVPVDENGADPADDSDLVIEDSTEAPVEEAPTPAPAPAAKPEPKEEAPVNVQVNVPKKEEVAAATSTASPVAEAVKDPNVGVSTDFKVDEEDFDDVDLEDDNTTSDANVVQEVNAEENMKQFQASVTEKIRPVTKKLDLGSFTLIKQPISISATSLGEDKPAASMCWALPNSDQFIAMREFTGKEIEQLGDTSGTNRFQTMKNRYNLIYDHVVSQKADTLEAWLKTISYSDNDHLFFTVYGANFAGSNYIPYDCNKCKNTFLSESIDLKDMYKYKDDEAKARFEKLLNSQDAPLKSGLYVSETVQMSDKIAIGFRDPSIWNIVFETALLDDKFQQKYRDIIAIISYIDKIYYIDAEHQTLQEINYKIDPNNTVKTIKAKIITYAKILAKLSPDQYYIILSYINSINTRRDDVTYVRPEATCPNCGELIPERETTAEELVFTRAQLATLAITSIK